MVAVGHASELQDRDLLRTVGSDLPSAVRTKVAVDRVFPKGTRRVDQSEFQFKF